jgi:Na+-transporting NADH:ubiquinone oxidoreductase subunit NqrB
MSMKRAYFRDARDFQILFLFIFLILGVWSRDWTLNPRLLLGVLGACLLTQYLGDFLTGRESSWRSALISGISLCLLLRANSVQTMIIAGVASIASKFLLRYRTKHFFNPSNLGIIAVLLFTSDAWVTPGQWGNDVWYALIFFALGGMVVRKVGRWETTGAFLCLYALLEAARNLWLGWTWDVYSHKMMSGSLLLFSFFMITDPRAIPDHPRARIFWTMSVAILTFVLRNYLFISTAPFWALFLLSPLTILMDRIWPASRFQWRPQQPEPVEIQSSKKLQEALT